MMKILGQLALKRAFILTGVLMLFLGPTPFMASQSAQFLGKDVSQVAAGIVGFYPLVAVGEVLRVFLAVFVVFFLLLWPWAELARTIRVGKKTLIFFPVAPVLIYLLILLGTVLKYPSFFTPFISLFLQSLIYRGAFVATPEMFWAVAALMHCGACVAAVLATCAPKTGQASLAKKRGIFLGMGAIALLGIVLCGGRLRITGGAHSPETEPRFPNVLFIAVDSLRYDRLSREDVTPVIQRLLSDPQSVSFSDHHVGVPRTFPSWIELISGKNAPSTGIRHMFPGFGARTNEFRGFVTKLRDAGYHTQIWSDFAGDIFPRFAGGFDGIHTPNLTLKTMIRLSVDQSFPFFLPILMSKPLRPFFPSLKQSPAFADPAHLTSEVMEELKVARSPWLDAVFYSGAHFPYAAPHPFYVRFTDHAYRGPFMFEKNPDLSMGKEGVSEADKEQVRGLYDGAVHAVDQDLGRLFDSLKEMGLWDSTLIVLTADHGEDLYENGRLQGHGEHLRGDNVLRVPLILKLPRHMAPLRHVVHETTRSVDVGTTVLNICGIEGSVGDGVNLLPWILSSAAMPETLEAYSETGIWFSRTGDAFFQKDRLDYPGISRLLSFDQGYSGEIVLDPRFEKIIVTAKHRSIVYGDYKIIYVPTPAGVKYELYNRRLDPYNLVDLSKVEPVRLEDMRSRLLRAIRKMEKNAVIIDDFVVPR